MAGVEEETPTRDQGGSGVAHLARAGAALELVNGLADVSPALRRALRQGATVRVQRDPAADERTVVLLIPVLLEDRPGQPSSWGTTDSCGRPRAAPSAPRGSRSGTK